MRYLPDKKLTVATARIAPKICTIYVFCTQLYDLFVCYSVIQFVSVSLAVCLLPTRLVGQYCLLADICRRL